MGKPLVMAQVEIGLRPIVRNKNLAMLKRAHRPRVDVQVGVELHQVDLDSARLQQAADRRCRETFPQRRHDATRYKDVLCRHVRDLFQYVFGLCGIGTIKYRRSRPHRQSIPVSPCGLAYISAMATMPVQLDEETVIQELIREIGLPPGVKFKRIDQAIDSVGDPALRIVFSAEVSSKYPLSKRRLAALNLFTDTLWDKMLAANITKLPLYRFLEAK